VTDGVVIVLLVAVAVEDEDEDDDDDMEVVELSFSSILLELFRVAMIEAAGGTCVFVTAPAVPIVSELLLLLDATFPTVFCILAASIAFVGVVVVAALAITVELSSIELADFLWVVREGDMEPPLLLLLLLLLLLFEPMEACERGGDMEGRLPLGMLATYSALLEHASCHALAYFLEHDRYLSSNDFIWHYFNYHYYCYWLKTLLFKCTGGWGLKGARAVMKREGGLVFSSWYIHVNKYAHEVPLCCNG
jgi:hypothetical protein